MRFIMALSMLFFMVSPAFAEEITIYSARMEQLIKPVFDAYTKSTGIKIKFITDKEGPLIQRMIAEGADSPADIFMAVDAGMLWKAAEEKLLKPTPSPTLKANIPSHLRDPNDRWFGLSVRARTIVFNTKKVNASELSTYEALGDAKWKKRLCLRTSKKVYNISLVAMMIADLGIEQTEKVVSSWVKNLAAPVFSDDVQVMKAVSQGICDVGIVNTYYYGLLMAKHPDYPLALFWPNQKDRGVHVNISGAGVTLHTKHEKAAVAFLEWLSSKEAQNLFAEVNFEYPVNPNVKPYAKVAKWGTFKQDMINVENAGKLQIDAVKLMDRAGYK
ncbi:MAG: extracellular solute-binding protein [Nitrospirae bacterium]|nr:extracellular solute-binding protein [Candidatus Troglogloeales bacterium]